MFDLNKTIIVANRPIFWLFFAIYSGIVLLFGILLLLLLGVVTSEVFNISSKREDIELMAIFASAIATCFLAILGLATIKAQKMQHDLERHHRAESFRAYGPIALSGLGDYVEQLAKLYNTVFLHAQDREALEDPTFRQIHEVDVLNAGVSSVALPTESLLDIRSYYEYCSSDKRPVLKEIFDTIQVINSRQRHLLTDTTAVSMRFFVSCFCNIAYLTCLINSQYDHFRDDYRISGETPIVTEPPKVSELLVRWHTINLISNELYEATEPHRKGFDERLKKKLEG